MRLGLWISGATLLLLLAPGRSPGALCAGGARPHETLRRRRCAGQLALLAILLLAFGLRLLGLDNQELRGDEAFGYFFSQRSPADLVEATIALAEPHPVAAYFVQKAWLALAGDSEFALRFR